MEVGSSSNCENFYEFFPNSSECFDNIRVNARNPNVDFTVEFKLFNVLIKAKPFLGFTDLKSEETTPDNNNNYSIGNIVDLSLSLSLSNNTEQSHDGDDIVINAVPLNVYNPVLDNDIEWTIRKTLTKSDCNEQHRLLIRKRAAESHILPFLSESSRLKVKSRQGLHIHVFDYDTGYEVQLSFKKWKSATYYGLMDNWKRDFVDNRLLIPGDVVGLRWDVDSNRLLFSVLRRNRNR